MIFHTFALFITYKFAQFITHFEKGKTITWVISSYAKRDFMNINSFGYFFALNITNRSRFGIYVK